MSVRTVSLVLAILIASVVFSAGLSAADDPMMGTWKLNLSKSKYNPGPAPRSRILKLEPAGNNTFKLTNDAVLANGEKTHVVETFIQDGKDHPLKDNPNADTQVNRQIDAYTTETINKKGGKTVQVLTRVVSKDGKTMTITIKGTAPGGAPLNDVRVFDKQ